MLQTFENASAEFQKIGKVNYDAAVRSYGELNKGLQAIAASVTDYSKQAFDDATRTFEKLVGAKSLESVIEIQSQYAKKAYDSWSPRLRSSAKCPALWPAMPTSRSSR